MTQTNYQTIEHTVSNGVATIALNRPEVHNAFNDVMIRELTDLLVRLNESGDLRVVVLTGRGRSFCAGADLNWMKRQVDYTHEENIADAMELAELMYALYTFPVPTIARVNGATIGGGTGLVAACDIAIAADRSRFSLSEVKIGLVPACISPYVLKRIGEKNAREFFLTGERMTAAKAMEIGLVNDVASEDAIDSVIEKWVQRLISSGPHALATCKELIQNVPQMSLSQAREYTAKVIADLRVGDEGQEGMKAFFEKRKPKWLHRADSPRE
jgi:methylglutaconyl-CoA hydratase